MLRNLHFLGMVLFEKLAVHCHLIATWGQNVFFSVQPWIDSQHECCFRGFRSSFLNVNTPKKSYIMYPWALLLFKYAHSWMGTYICLIFAALLCQLLYVSAGIYITTWYTWVHTSDMFYPLRLSWRKNMRTKKPSLVDSIHDFQSFASKINPVDTTGVELWIWLSKWWVILFLVFLKHIIKHRQMYRNPWSWELLNEAAMVRG